MQNWYTLARVLLPCEYLEQSTTSCGDKIGCAVLFVTTRILASFMPAEENAKQLPHPPEIHTQQLIEIRADVTKIPIEKENK